jgi:hypothetical protein
MLKKVLITVVVLIAAFLGYVAMQPADYLIAREVTISASDKKIFPYLNNSEKANMWMPWQETDPSVKMTYSGPAEGVGSISSWDSTGRMGTGEAKVIESIPNKSVKMQITYTKPMQMVQLSEFSMTPAGKANIVRWSVKGTNPFIGRIFCAFSNMDKMVGGSFEKGLAKLKALAEK